MTQRHQVPGGHGTAQKHVVVEVEEGLGEVGDAMQVEFDGERREGGKNRTVGEDEIMRDDRHARVRCVQPGGNLAVCHDVDVADPRSIHF